MHVNTDGLRTGANTTYTAADHTYDGKTTLSRASVPSGIFGDFEAARSFHQAVSTAHHNHVTRIDDHADRLGTIGEKAHCAAADFGEMETRNKISLDGVDDAVTEV